MLESDYQSELAELQAKLTCQVEVPPEWGDYMSGSGVVAPTHNDRRRFVRHRFRSRVILELSQTLPSIPREREFHSIYTRDLSRQGVSFLHSRQLFPCERCVLWFPQRKMRVDVVSCRRFNSRCYLTAGRLITSAEL
jgi:hypothetical protein